MNIRIHILCFFLVLFLRQLPAQTWFFRQYTAEQGLPSTEVHDLLQDREGHIWVATDRGVARFDGYSFEVFTTKQGLSSNVVFKLQEGPDGKIWFGEMPGTFSYFEKGKIYPAPENPALKKHFKSTAFPVSLSIKKDYMDVGYIGYGFFRLQGGKIRNLNEKDTAAYTVTVNGHEVLFGSKKHLGSLQIDYKGKHSFPITDLSHGRRIRALKRRNGDLIVSTSGNAFVVKKNGLVKTFTSPHFLLFFETPDSCLYVGTDKGFCKFAPNEDYVEDNRYHHLSACRVSHVIMDKEGGLWIATLNKGIFYCSNPAFMTYDFKSEWSEGSNFVHSLCGDYNGNILLSLEDGCVYSINREGKTSLMLPPGKKPIYSHVYYDTVNSYLITNRTDGDLLMNSDYKKKKRYLSVFNTAHDLVPYKNGYLSGGYNVLEAYRKEPGKTQMKSRATLKTGANVQCIFRLKEDSIFIGTLFGLFLFQNDSLKPLLVGTAYQQERINSIEYVNRHKLVLATLGKGLLFYDLRTGTIETFTEKNGLSSDFINDLSQSADGTLWIASNKGLSRLSRTKKGTYDVYNYDAYNGMPVSDIKQVHADGDKVYMGTHNGLIVFDTKSRMINHDALIRLRNVYVNEKKVAPAELASLDFHRNNIRISYLSVIPKMLGKVLYRYRLEGSENGDQWTHIREPELFLPSLEPGEYRFIIQALNGSGQWSELPLVLPIYISAPFWKTWWFILICILVVIGTLIILLNARLKHLHEKALNERLMMDYQQQALINQINPHFLFNSMNSIQKYILRDDKKQAVSFVSKFAKLMRMSLEQSREPFVSLSEELEMLSLYMLLEEERFGKKIEYLPLIQPELEEKKLMIPPMLIQPFIENAIRHGILNKPEKGKVTLRLYLKAQSLFCEVEDDGVGRQKALEIKNRQTEQIHRSFAMSINTSRLQLLAKLLNSDYFFEVTDRMDDTGNPAGTLVKLILPYKYEP